MKKDLSIDKSFQRVENPILANILHINCRTLLRQPDPDAVHRFTL